MYHFILRRCSGIEVLTDILRQDGGQDLAEYAIVISLIALGAVAAMPGLAATISSTFTSLGTKMTAYTS